MDEFFFSLSLDSKRTLCIGPITRREAANLPDSRDGTGLFLFVVDASNRGQEIKILSRLVSLEMAADLANMIRAGKLTLADA